MSCGCKRSRRKCYKCCEKKVYKKHCYYKPHYKTYCKPYGRRYGHGHCGHYGGYDGYGPLVAGTVEVTRASINRERRRDGAFFVFSQVLRNLSYNRGKGLMEVWICNS